MNTSIKPTSSPVKIYGEWALFVVYGDVYTSTSYFLALKPGYDPVRADSLDKLEAKLDILKSEV